MQWGNPATSQTWALSSVDKLDAVRAGMCNRGFEIVFAEPTQGTSQWILRAANGFNGALADPFGNAALILSGKGCKPVNITSASGIPVTSLTHTYKTKCTWKEIFEFQGRRYSWKYSGTSCHCYEASSHQDVAQMKLSSSAGIWAWHRPKAGAVYAELTLLPGVQDPDLQRVLMATAAIFHLRAKSSYDVNTANEF